MVSVQNLSLQYGKRILFDEVNLNFTPGNCYGVIGANGAGKSTFMKILSGEIDPTKGRVDILPGMRMSVLKQDHFAFNHVTVMDTVIMGNKRLYSLIQEKNALYAKSDFSDADGIKASELESEFAELNGWDAETQAAQLLTHMGIAPDLHTLELHLLSGKEKVKTLLAQALFGNPDILLLDEPTNDLDQETITWLENFLADFTNTVVVISHDRHFLDAVCTHVCDIDYGKIHAYSGNYSFWYHMSQLQLRQRSEQNKKIEDKRKELQDFVSRFSANASKSRQATSRKKLLEKLTIDEIPASTRRYPGIIFKPEREAGDQILLIEKLSIPEYFAPIDLNLERGDKVAVIGKQQLAISLFLSVLGNVHTDFKGTFQFGTTISMAYLPNHNESYFETNLNLIDWLRQFSKEKDETYIRGFLGKMLFSGEEVLKSCRVLSGGERVRCMLSRMMLLNPNVLIMDEPTNHLDLESITALNDALIEFPGSILFTSHDHQLTQTVANRILELGKHKCMDKRTTYDTYLTNESWKAQRLALH